MTTTMPKIEDFGLDAYGHLTYVVGFSDEDRDPDENEMEAIIRSAEMTEEEFEEWQETAGVSDRGDWIACADAQRIGDFVAYHVVVNSESGGFIDTMEQGILSVEDARVQLPGLLETWDDVASEHLVVDGAWFTKQEREENLAAIQRWKDHLKEILK